MHIEITIPPHYCQNGWNEKDRQLPSIGEDVDYFKFILLVDSVNLSVVMMNEKAKKLGLNDTNFKNATGLDEANHYSSAHDMAMMARELIKHEKIFEFTTIYEDYLRQNTDNKFWLVNTNKLIKTTLYAFVL